MTDTTDNMGWLDDDEEGKTADDLARENADLKQRISELEAEPQRSASGGFTPGGPGGTPPDSNRLMSRGEWMQLYQADPQKASDLLHRGKVDMSQEPLPSPRGRQ
jgi:hypothetical protein